MHEDVDGTIRTPRSDGAAITKKPYRKPVIEDYGSVVELTQTGGGTSEDAGSPSFDFSGAAG